MFTDRHYTSIPLAQALSERNTAFTGTSNKNTAELPDDIRQMSSLKGGEVLAYRTSKLLALAWQAEKRKKPVFMVSTEASASLVTVQPRNSHNSPVIKPSVVDLYNHNMNGVDIADQHSVYYAFQRKTRKWWRKVFFWLVETTVVQGECVCYWRQTPLPSHFPKDCVGNFGHQMHFECTPSPSLWPTQEETSAGR